MNKEFIFGNAQLNNIVSCEATDDGIELFFEKDGEITTEIYGYKPWLLSNRPFKVDNIELKGNQYYRHMRQFDSKEKLYEYKRYDKSRDFYTVYDDKEAAMVLHGFGYFQGMKVKDVSVLSFDIEATTLGHNSKSKVLLISNTFRSGDVVSERLFCFDDYDSQAEMLDDWCNWVRQMNPSVMVGHNIFGYDIPYLNFIAKKNDTELVLGRNDTPIKIQKKPSQFRKDGSQSYEYKKAYIYGREIVDTMFVAYHYDFSRKYVNYGLKNIITQEGLEAEDRQHYDASKIAENYKDPEEWKKIKSYAEHDSRDSLALYDLMIASFFYLTQSVPKSFQAINCTATGSQVNSFLVRSYLQDGWSIPKLSEPERFEGAISFGVPGIYKNVFKLDVAALYPSIMLQYEIYDKRKDPNKHFLKMLEYFTNKRLEYKSQYKKTKDKHYKYLDQMAKIFINSAYGLLGATGLPFNSPENAALVTRKGREILCEAIEWATNKDYNYWYGMFKERTGKNDA